MISAETHRVNQNTQSVVPEQGVTSGNGLPEGLRALEKYQQFVVYRRADKVPVDPLTGRPSDKNLPSNQLSYQAALEAASNLPGDYRVGFVLTAGARVAVVDIDGCRDPDTGQLTVWAEIMIAMLPGAYVEISISGTGIHIWFSYHGEMPPHAKKVDGHGEFYHEDRYFALGTPLGQGGSVQADLTAALPNLTVILFAPNTADTEDAAWSDAPFEGSYAAINPGWSDDELLNKARQSTNAAAAFGSSGVSFEDLWTANAAKLGARWPDAGSKGRAYDESSADAGLAQRLAWWTGGDCARIERIMRRSDCNLVREKWDWHKTYLQNTILKAVARQDGFYGDQPTTAAAVAALAGVGEGAGGPIARGGDGLLSLEQQRSHFAGCVYIQSQHRVLIPSGEILKPEVFKVQYGGFIFTLDSRNAKTTRDAFEAFTQSQGNDPESAYATCFKPQLPFGKIITRNGQRFVNVFLPLSIERIQGDASLFLDHLAKLLPDQRDATIFLSYMAACVQHQGFKFQWAPLLQGVPGNGKTLFSNCVEKAVGERYTHRPTAKKLSEKFNQWMTGKVFYAVEDIYVPDSKREILEYLKPMITGWSLEIEGKGVDQVTSDICGNFIFNSNHKDGIIKTDDDRRFAIFFTAQQAVDDLSRNGMGTEYFAKLWRWLKEEGGYAIVNELLHTYAIPVEFNPAGDCQRAPYTSSTREAIAVSKGGIEQEIDEAVAQGLPGFSGGWISTMMLGRFLEEKGLARRAPLNKRQQILKQMGYVPHPALKDGRVNNLVLPDNAKPRLFVHVRALAAQITSPSEAAKGYETANRGIVGHPAGPKAFGGGV